MDDQSLLSKSREGLKNMIGAVKKPDEEKGLFLSVKRIVCMDMHVYMYVHVYVCSMCSVTGRFSTCEKLKRLILQS